ncbi:DMT family transporter [Paenibacillus lutrae]|uniref:EamA family transporter n=1 Tax=Paenibacillus lutrae TaxID=2078573 RepID=A0A7X3FML5_9BACL|nr:DMT family transporter [Paenibacillus lutrae]MVP02516.1 EamA family transporter [Paenibacillus lutrae]
MTAQTTDKPLFPVWIAFVVGIIGISFSAIFVRWSSAPVAVTAMYRLLLTTLIMLPFLFRYTQEIRNIRWKSLAWLISSGFFLGLHFLLWMASLSYTTVASSTALLTLEPIFVMGGAYLIFRQKSSLGTIAGILIAMIGAAMIGWGDFRFSGEALRGDILSVVSAAAVAVHMLIGKSMRESMSAFVYSFFVFLAAGAVLGLYNIAQGTPLTGYSQTDWTMFLLLAIVPTLFGHYLFNWLLKYMKAATVSMSVLGEPLGSTILAYYLLSEAITGIQVGAGLLLLSGIWLFIRSQGRETGQDELLATPAVPAPLPEKPVASGDAAASTVNQPSTSR